MATTPGAVTCDFLVLDGDSSCKNTIEKVVPGVKSVACFNHYTKALYKRLSAKFKLSQRVVKKAVKATKTTPAVAAVVDICRCKGTHKWTGKHCGCANDKTAKHIQSLVFAAGVKAGKDAAVFKRLVDEILLHMRGDHSTCTFHSKLQCNCSAKCLSRRCDCGECPPERSRTCFGEPAEPTCTGIPWASSVSSVTCDYHYSIIKEELEGIIRTADSVIVEALGHKVDTCHNEGLHKFMLDARNKGLNMSPGWYAAMTNIGK
jgi:hypothetical protein